MISRGELVEIGGDFRVPDVLARSGAFLNEVGTTNRTKISDYEKAIGENTGLLLRVHPSNFRVVGFTSAPEIGDLAKLAHDHGSILVEDAGSGASEAIASIGLSDEPVISKSVGAGVDVVMFSGDKLLGGPQSGLIVGRRELIDRIRRHPLYRALRVDKLIYAALEATLESHLRGTAIDDVPVLKMLSMSREELNERTRLFVDKLKVATSGESALEIKIVDGHSAVGGGAAPTFQPGTVLVALSNRDRSAGSIDEQLRNLTPPVIARIIDDRVCLDLRTVPEADEDDLLSALLQV